MSLVKLTVEEREVIRRSIAATFQYLDFDFHSRLGVTEEEVREILSAWPTADDAKDNSPICLAINNSMNDLLHGIGISDSEALKHIGVDREEMLRVFRKWKRGLS